MTVEKEINTEKNNDMLTGHPGRSLLFFALPMIPVSYTHLDVYKRQGKHKDENHGFTPTAGTAVGSQSEIHADIQHRARINLLWMIYRKIGSNQQYACDIGVF